MMIQYGTGADIVGGDPDQVQAEQDLAAQLAAAQAAEQSGKMTGLLVLGVAAYLYLQWRKKKKGGG
jgi:hypothetical protein